MTKTLNRTVIGVVIAIAMTFALVGCGSSGNSSSSSATPEKVVCPHGHTTKHFAKTRFVADVGLIAGSFHHWIWKPYKQGKFKSGADGRIKAILKAGATALFIHHMAGNALDNAKASPTLCKWVAQPLANLKAKLGNLKDDVMHGNLGALSGMNGTIGSIKSVLGKHGTQIAEKFKS